MIVEDFCAARRGRIWSWARATPAHRGLQYVYRESPGLVCSWKKGVLGHLHLYGLSATGPYYGEELMRNVTPDDVVQTPARICRGLELFTHRVGAPKAIMFNSLLWDAMRLKMTTEWGGYAATRGELGQFRHDFSCRLCDLARCAPRLTRTLVLRTTPASPRSGSAALDFNRAIRRIASELTLSVIDFDALLWSGALKGRSRVPLSRARLTKVCFSVFPHGSIRGSRRES
eukprot:4968657-Prymnesium_polylepis.2